MASKLDYEKYIGGMCKNFWFALDRFLSGQIQREAPQLLRQHEADEAGAIFECRMRWHRQDVMRLVPDFGDRCDLFLTAFRQMDLSAYRGATKAFERLYKDRFYEFELGCWGSEFEVAFGRFIEEKIGEARARDGLARGAGIEARLGSLDGPR